MLIGKSKIETMCRAAGMVPAKRARVDGAEVFVADGFSAPPHFAYRRFGIGPEQFPFGMFATLWWASKGDEKLDTGQPLFFDAFHDPQYSPEGKKRARINTAMKEAKSFLARRKKAH